MTLARRLAFSSALTTLCAAMLVSTLLAVVVPKTEWVLEWTARVVLVPGGTPVLNSDDLLPLGAYRG